MARRKTLFVVLSTLSSISWKIAIYVKYSTFNFISKETLLSMSLLRNYIHFLV